MKITNCDIRYFLIKNDTVYTHITKNGYISKHTPQCCADETTNSHVNIGDKEIELLIIASVEALKCQNKKCGEDEVFALVKDSLEETITIKSFEKSLSSLQANRSLKLILFLTAFLKIFQFLKFVLKILVA